MQRQNAIQKTLQNALNPEYLEVINESYKHNVPEGSESHFKLIVVSAEFEGKRLIARHRILNKLLQSEFDQGMHALSLHTMTHDEWLAKNQQVAETPECLGGGK